MTNKKRQNHPKSMPILASKATLVDHKGSSKKNAYHEFSFLTYVVHHRQKRQRFLMEQMVFAMEDRTAAVKIMGSNIEIQGQKIWEGAKP